VNVVREDPVRPGLLYAGSERGVFVSFDDGDHWQPLQNGLPRTSIRDITIHGDDLVIATHGRGFYIMDDIVPLRALAENASGGPRLLAPAPAIRVHGPPFVGTPMPRDEPLAPNPPNGAYLDYILGPGAGLVQIAILDQAGAPVARFSSQDAAPKPDLAKIDTAPEWLETTIPPPATPGQHRFVWNLRYASPADLPDSEFGPAGIWAPPGQYVVELTVDGQVQRQALEIRADPRVKVTPAGFQAEFALARQIEQARLEARRALAAAAKASLPPPPGLREIAERLAKLAEAVDSADAAPSPDAMSGFRQARVALDAALAKSPPGPGDVAH
jgi:hypothetical protein